nr:MAG TPA: hypothetical protein [Caudoviricetes sp.]
MLCVNHCIQYSTLLATCQAFSGKYSAKCSTNFACSICANCTIFAINQHFYKYQY